MSIRPMTPTERMEALYGAGIFGGSSAEIWRATYAMRETGRITARTREGDTFEIIVEDNNR
jgi:hypothetical protein